MDYQTLNRENKGLTHNARTNFVKKVYTTLSLQLMVTVAFVIMNIQFRAFAKFQRQNNLIFWLAFIGSIISLIALFFAKISKVYPTNLAVMSVFTLCESYLVSYICSIYTAQSVLLAAVATLSATLGLTYFAMTTEQDFTSMRCYGKGLLSSVIWIALCVSFVNLIFIRSSFVVMLLAGVMAIVYSVYILVDTQMILGGKNKELTLDDHILGATILYVDVISLFLKLLQLLGKKRDD